MLSWDEFDKEDEVALNAVKAAPTVVEMSLDKLDKDGQNAAVEARAVSASDSPAIARAKAALDQLDIAEGLAELLQQGYSLRLVNRPDEQSGFWTIPEVNTDATNYYIVVEALDADGETLELPILNEENGQTEVVAKWGIRVPEAAYDSVVADKRDDGIIQNNEIGRKTAGFLDVEYSLPVLGGAVTQW